MTYLWGANLRISFGYSFKENLKVGKLEAHT